MTFGDRMREYRDHRGWSLGDLARATHYSRGHLSNVENSRKTPTEELVRACDRALRAKGELIGAYEAEAVARLDLKPWETAELVQRMQVSDTTSRTLETLHATVEELCCQYNRRDALELRREAHGWLQRVVDLLHRPTGLKAHQELLVAGGWLALLAGCVEYDLGLRSAAEATRTAAVQLGVEAEHREIVGWGHEMTAWFALTQGRFRQAIDADRARAHAQTVIRDNIAPDGSELSPMRISECRLTLGFVAGREGDLEQAVGLGLDGLREGRQSRVHLLMVAGELDQELRSRYPGEGLVRDLGEALRAV